MHLNKTLLRSTYKVKVEKYKLYGITVFGAWWYAQGKEG